MNPEDGPPRSAACGAGRGGVRRSEGPLPDAADEKGGGAPRAAFAWALLAGAAAFAAAAAFASPELGGLGGDDAEYVLLARAIREQGAYVTTWAPGAAVPHTLYPPVVPLLLAPFVGPPGASLTAVHVVLAAAGGAAVSLLTLLFARRGLPPAAAALGALAPALSPLWIRCASDVLSELPFLAFAAASLLALDTRGDDRLSPPRALLAALFASLAFLSRAAGIALVPWVVLACVLPRRGAGRAGWAAAALLVTAVAGWLAWCAASGGGSSYLGFVGRGESGADAPTALLERAWTALVGEYLPGLPAFVFPRAGAGWDACGWALWGLAALGVAAGVVRMRRLRAPEAFAATTLAVLCTWQFRDPRFGVPLLPLVVGLALEGVHVAGAVLRERLRALATPAVAAALVLPNLVQVGTVTLPRASRATPPVAGTAPGLALPAVARFHETWRLDDASFPEGAAPVTSFLLLCRAIRTDPSAPPGPLLASNPRVAALLTGRAALAPADGESPEATLDRMREAGADLLLVDAFIDSRSSAVREIVRRRAADLETLAAVGETYLLRVRPPL